MRRQYDIMEISRTGIGLSTEQTLKMVAIIALPRSPLIIFLGIPLIIPQLFHDRNRLPNKGYQVILMVIGRNRLAKRHWLTSTEFPRHRSPGTKGSPNNSEAPDAHTPRLMRCNGWGWAMVVVSLVTLVESFSTPGWFFTSESVMIQSGKKKLKMCSRLAALSCWFKVKKMGTAVVVRPSKRPCLCKEWSLDDWHLPWTIFMGS